MRIQVTIDVAPDLSEDRVIGSGSFTVEVEYARVDDVPEVAKRAAEAAVKGVERRA